MGLNPNALPFFPSTHEVNANNKLPVVPVKKLYYEQQDYHHIWVTMDDVDALRTAVSVALFVLEDDS